MDYVEYHKYYLQYLHLMYLINLRYGKRKYRQRKVWVRDIFLKRKQKGDYENLVKELRNDPEKYFNYFRMSPTLFDSLLEAVSSRITKMFHTRQPISPAEKLSATLRYLASGDSMVSISYAYRLGRTTVSHIINETCEAIWEVLCGTYLPTPNVDQWQHIAKSFYETWQLPNCLGAIDGKHVLIQAPPKAGSEFFNYKNCHSIVLLAVCDAEYKFTIVDIGAKGKQSDAGILRHSEFGKRLFDNALDLPDGRPIEYAGEDIPFYFLGDEAFPLRSNLMRPYPGKFLPQDKRIFNYRLSRGRRVIENSFGILASRWRILRKPIIASLKTTENIIKATICLHNFIISNRENIQNYCPPNFVDYEDLDGNFMDGHWRSEQTENLQDIPRSGSNFFSNNANDCRNSLAAHFMTEGAISYQ